MLGETALEYFKRGYNCSQCIIKAAGDIYKLDLGINSMDMLRGVSNGFGIGGLCSILTAGIMVFGMLFDENTTKRLRIALLSEVSRKYGAVSCPCLSRKLSCSGGCGRLVKEVGNMIEDIIKGEY